MIDQDYSSIFYDKRDDNYLPIDNNNIYYYDMFIKKKLKCKEKIPETLCYINNNSNLWFFNSRKDPKDTSILKKNPENIKDYIVLTKFLPIKGFTDPLENNVYQMK
jgi:hypothetical protein